MMTLQVCNAKSVYFNYNVTGIVYDEPNNVNISAQK